MAFTHDWFRAIHKATDTTEIKSTRSTVTDIVGNEVVREIGQEGNCPFKLLDDFQQHLRTLYPIEWRHRDQSGFVNHGHHETRNQSHIVVERQPTDDYIFR